MITNRLRASTAKRLQWLARALATGWALALPATAAEPEPPHANEAVFPLLRDLDDPDASVRTGAAMALRELGPLAWPALPRLVDALTSDPHVMVRAKSAGALGALGPAGEEAVPALTAGLSDPHRFVRSWSAMALSEIGPKAVPATAELVANLSGDAENLRGRSWCATALRGIEAPAEIAVPALIEALGDASDEVRAATVLSLEHYGAEASERGALEPLLETLRHDPHWKPRGNAACALPELVGDGLEAEGRAERMVSSLAAALGDEAPYVRGCAARALGELGRPAVRTAVDLGRLLEDPDLQVRQRARRALARLEGLEPY